MRNPLPKLYSFLEREDGYASIIQVKANPSDFSKIESEEILPAFEEIESSARAAGEYLGKQSTSISDLDKKVLMDILGAISQMALDENSALVQENCKEDKAITMFFSNSIEVARIEILEPMIRALKESRNDLILNYFKSLCECHAGLWEAFEDELGSAANKVAVRMKELFEKAFAVKELSATD